MQRKPLIYSLLSAQNDMSGHVISGVLLGHFKRVLSGSMSRLCDRGSDTVVYRNADSRCGQTYGYRVQAFEFVCLKLICLSALQTHTGGLPPSMGPLSFRRRGQKERPDETRLFLECHRSM